MQVQSWLLTAAEVLIIKIRPIRSILPAVYILIIIALFPSLLMRQLKHLNFYWAMMAAFLYQRFPQVRASRMAIGSLRVMVTTQANSTVPIKNPGLRNILAECRIMVPGSHGSEKPQLV